MENTNIILVDNINTFKGFVPDDADLVCYEKGTNPMDGYVLYGFDEIGMFDREFKNPAYAFVTDEEELV